MKSYYSHVFLVAAACVLAVGTVPATPAAAAISTPTSPTVLPTVTGGGYASVWAINRRGDILGYDRDVNGQFLSLMWRNVDEVTVLPAPVGDWYLSLNNRGDVIGNNLLLVHGSTEPVHIGGNTTAINDRRQVVGDTRAGARHAQAFIWQGGTLTLLPTPDGMDSHAVDINEQGQVLGYVTNADWSVQRAVVWQHGVMTDLGTLGGPQVSPGQLNNRGQVIGYSATADGSQHPFLWEHGRMVDLLAGTGEDYGVAYAISDSGVVVGQVGLRPAFWRNGTLTGIGPAGYYGEAVAINTRGVIAGRIYPSEGSYEDYQRSVRAFRWQDGRMTILGTLDGSLGVKVMGIDDRGRIAGGVTVGWDDYPVVWNAR